MLTITLEDLLQWYFEGDTLEVNNQIKITFQNALLDNLKENKDISFISILESQVQRGAVPLNILREFKGSTSMLLVSDLRDYYTINIVQKSTEGYLVIGVLK